MAEEVDEVGELLQGGCGGVELPAEPTKSLDLLPLLASLASRRRVWPEFESLWVACCWPCLWLEASIGSLGFVLVGFESDFSVDLCCSCWLDGGEVEVSASTLGEFWLVAEHPASNR